MSRSILLVYFSGTGNTEIVTKLIEKELKKSNNVQTVKVEDILHNKISMDIEEFDILGIGYPIHAFNPPRIIYDFVKYLDSGYGKRIFVFSTCAGPLYFNAIASYSLRRKLKRKGYNFFYERQFYMPSNIVITYPKEVVKQLYDAAIEKTKKMVEEINGDVVRRRQGRLTFIPRILLDVVYIFVKISLYIFPLDFKVGDDCNLCKKCMDRCPQDNIHVKTDKIKFHLNCLACFKCVYGCPQQAITARLYNFAILEDRYNIMGIVNDPSIEEKFIAEKTRGYYKIFYDYLNDVDK